MQENRLKPGRTVINDSDVFEPQRESTLAWHRPRKSTDKSEPENRLKPGIAVIDDSVRFEPQRESTSWRGPKCRRKSTEPEMRKFAWRSAPRNTSHSIEYVLRKDVPTVPLDLSLVDMFGPKIMCSDILPQQEKKGDAAIFDPRFVGYFPPFNRADIQAQSSFRNIGDLARGLS
ncbi:hypothetical protein JB92DRAFT_1743109 [Gautieria morchelliformis]|nr:hypothetical protein JB92DRAFT_1743109 [Gautieria morchelliformis]